MNIEGSFWEGKQYHLEQMDMRSLVIAYIQYPAIQAYFSIAVAGAIYLSVVQAWSWVMFWIAVLVMVVYPLVWYVLHRYVLHGQFLYKSPQFAKVWKRIHYDHHRDPNDLRVLFGALYTTLPTIVLVVLPIGGLLAGWNGVVMGIAAGVAVTMFYEFCHCIQHLHYTPKYKFLQDMKRLHLLHHFRNENGNYGITNFVFDRLAGTYYDKDDGIIRSDTVFNLGYDENTAKRYPWVAELSVGDLLDSSKDS